jgi:hypothetical protein
VLCKHEVVGSIPSGSTSFRLVQVKEFAARIGVPAILHIVKREHVRSPGSGLVGTARLDRIAHRICSASATDPERDRPNGLSDDDASLRFGGRATDIDHESDEVT